LAAAGLALAALCHGGPALAWAWPMAKGETQAILKYELEEADEAFDIHGVVVPIPEQDDESVSLFVEHGATDRITIQGKIGWTRGEDLFSSY